MLWPKESAVKAESYWADSPLFTLTSAVSGMGPEMLHGLAEAEGVRAASMPGVPAHTVPLSVQGTT